MALSSTAGAAASEPAVPKQTRSVAPFLIKLFDILSKAGHEQYISWARDGNTVLVSDPDGFAGHVLPKYFKHSNFRSFMRQLNIYGFAWSCSDAIAGSIVFHHPSFVQGRWDLLAGNFRREGKMQRKRGRESPDGQKAAHSHKATYAQDKDRSSAAVEHQNVRAVQQEVHQLDASLRDVMRTTDAHLDAVLMACFAVVRGGGGCEPGRASHGCLGLPHTAQPLWGGVMAQSAALAAHMARTG